MSRTRRFAGGVGLGYVYFGFVTLVGLWLTPFLLARIGQQDYGLWLVSSQLLAYLTLLDLGVVALLPRETAYATGGASGAEERAARVGRTMRVAHRLVRWQTPVVALVALGAWFVVSHESPPLAIPFAIILATFVALFPWRVFQAVLQGLQELAFLGKVQLAGWAAGTAVVIALVLAGAGLYALAAGWVVTQATVLFSSRARLRTRFAEVLPERQAVRRNDVKGYAVRATWISVGQVAQVLLSGSDLLIIGKLLGAAAVVPYACTAKLVTVLTNHPQLLMQSALPALSEMRAAQERERLVETSTALTLAMLVMGGAVAAVVLAVNEGFVSWWVGSSQYLGVPVTTLLVVTMLVRHWNITAIYALFCFGQERRVSLTNLVDGLVTVVAITILVPWIGFAGVPLGSLVAVLAASLPWNLRKTALSMEVPARALIAPLWPWAWRATMVGAGSAVVGRFFQPSTFLQLAATTVLVAGAYAAVMFWGLRQTALGRFVRPRLVALWPRAERFVAATPPVS